MTVDIKQAHDVMVRCRRLRDDGAVEAVLRGEFQSRLRRVFPSVLDERWIDHYGEGAETLTTISTSRGASANRFMALRRRV